MKQVKMVLRQPSWRYDDEINAYVKELYDHGYSVLDIKMDTSMAMIIYETRHKAYDVFYNQDRMELDKHLNTYYTSNGYEIEDISITFNGIMYVATITYWGSEIESI